MINNISIIILTNCKDIIIPSKVNLFLITEKTDFLKLININPIKRYIIDFLANIYSFKYELVNVFIVFVEENYKCQKKLIFNPFLFLPIFLYFLTVNLKGCDYKIIHLFVLQ